MIDLIPSYVLKAKSKGTGTYFSMDSRGEPLKLRDIVAIYYRTNGGKACLDLCEIYTNAVLTRKLRSNVGDYTYAYIIKLDLDKTDLDFYDLISSQLLNTHSVISLADYTAFHRGYQIGKISQNKNMLLEYLNRPLKVGDFVYYTTNQETLDCGIVISEDKIINTTLRKIKVDMVLKVDTLTEKEKQIYKVISENMFNSVQANCDGKIRLQNGGVFATGTVVYLYLNKLVIRCSDGKYLMEYYEGSPLFFELLSDRDKLDVFRLKDTDYWVGLLQNVLTNNFKRLYTVFWNPDGNYIDSTSVKLNTLSSVRTKKPKNLEYLTRMDVSVLNSFDVSFKYKGKEHMFRFEIFI